MGQCVERECLVITLAGVVREGLSGEWHFRWNLKGEKEPSLEKRGRNPCRALAVLTSWMCPRSLEKAFVTRAPRVRAKEAREEVRRRAEAGQVGLYKPG